MGCQVLVRGLPIHCLRAITGFVHRVVERHSQIANAAIGSLLSSALELNHALSGGLRKAGMPG